MLHWLRDVAALGVGLALGAYLVELQRTLRLAVGYRLLRAAARIRERARREHSSVGRIEL